MDDDVREGGGPGERSGSRPRPPWPPFWTVFAFWTAVAVISAGHAAPHHDSVVRGALYELVSHWAWAALTPLVFLLARRFPLDRSSRAVAILVHLAAAVVVGIVWGTFSEVVHQRIGHPAEPFPGVTTVLGSQVAFGFSPGLVIYFAILAAAHAFEYYRESRRRRTEALGLRSELAEARLETLRMQLQPHFLFNTLNTISGLVASEPDRTRRVVARLSELLRETLDEPGTTEVSLARELELLDAYEEIVRARFGERIRIERRIAPETLDLSVPRLSLQPLVENAVEHGFGETTGRGTITVVSRLSGGMLVLAVSDDGGGPAPSDSDREGSGVGLRNVRDRLRHLHGERASVELSGREGGGTVARIVIPA